jgi:excisionase family DNA binding protein
MPHIASDAPAAVAMTDEETERLINEAAEKAMRKAGFKKDKSRSLPLAYSVMEIVEGTSLSRSTVYSAIRRGALRSVRIGARRIILHADLQRWLEGQPPTSD